MLSRMACNLGPLVSYSFCLSLCQGKVTHLNLHSNGIKALMVKDDLDEVTNCQNNITVEFLNELPDLLELDISSNLLGDARTTITLQQRTFPDSNGPSLLSLATNLQVLNLSANNLTGRSLQGLFDNVHMQNLTKLNLSYNSIKNLPPNDMLVEICPNLRHLNLVSNALCSISKLVHSLCPDLKSLTNLHLMDGKERVKRIGVNPICYDRIDYRSKVLCAIPSLVELDGVIVTTSEKNKHRMNLVAGIVQEEIEIKGLSHHEKVEKRKQIKVVNNFTKRTACSLGHIEGNKDTVHLNPVRSAQSQFKDDNERSRRMKNATRSISLQKLSSLENQVRLLSGFAEEQARSTMKLAELHSNKDFGSDRNHSNGVKTMHSKETHIIGNNESLHNETYCPKRHAAVQTSDVVACKDEEHRASSHEVCINVSSTPKLQRHVSNRREARTAIQNCLMSVYYHWKIRVLNSRLMKVEDCNEEHKNMLKESKYDNEELRQRLSEISHQLGDKERELERIEQHMCLTVQKTKRTIERMRTSHKDELTLSLKTEQEQINDLTDELRLKSNQMKLMEEDFIAGKKRMKNLLKMERAEKESKIKECMIFEKRNDVYLREEEDAKSEVDN